MQHLCRTLGEQVSLMRDASEMVPQDDLPNSTFVSRRLLSTLNIPIEIRRRASLKTFGSPLVYHPRGNAHRYSWRPGARQAGNKYPGEDHWKAIMWPKAITCMRPKGGRPSEPPMESSILRWRLPPRS